MEFMELTRELYADGKRAVRTALGLATVAAYAAGCGDGCKPTDVTCNPVYKPEARGVAISPSQPYDDEDLTGSFTTYDPNPNGRNVTTRIRWKRGSEYISPLDNQRNVSSDATQPGDNWIIEVTPIAGNDTGTTRADTVNIREIPYVTRTVPVTDILRNPIQGMNVILQYSNGADTVQTDTDGRATFRWDARGTVPASATLSILSSTWYNFTRPQNLAAQPDTAFVIDRFVDANGVDKLEYCKYETITDGSGLNNLLMTFNKPLLSVYLARATEPTPGLGDYAWRGFDAWNLARGRQLFAETQDSANADIVISYENRPNTYTEIIVSAIGNIDHIAKAIIHVPMTKPLHQTYTRTITHESGHAQGLIREWTGSGYVMYPGGSTMTPQIVESGCSLILSQLRSGTDMAQHSR